MSRLHTRGQIMMEFVLVLAIAVIISMVYLVAANNLLKDTSEEQRVMEIDNIGYAVQDEIILATSVSDGYSRTIFLPEKAGRFVYTISSDGTGITLQSDSYSQFYETPHFTGSIHKGNNIIQTTGVVMIS